MHDLCKLIASILPSRRHSLLFQVVTLTVVGSAISVAHRRDVYRFFHHSSVLPFTRFAHLINATSTHLPSQYHQDLDLVAIFDSVLNLFHIRLSIARLFLCCKKCIHRNRLRYSLITSWPIALNTCPSNDAQTAAGAATAALRG